MQIRKKIRRVTGRVYNSHIPTPLPVGIVLDNNMSPKTDSEKQAMADKPYRSLLGAVMWGSVAATRLKVNLKAEVSHVLVQVTLHFLM